MNKKLQDHAWLVLPKEFKENVKELYAEIEVELSKEKGATFDRTRQFRAMISQLVYLFGKHNLPSNADGEEMLIVPRSKVIEVRNKYAAYVGYKLQPLLDLFGSKCLPDNIDSLSQNPAKNCDNANLISTDDNKPAEPKFKSGDLAIYLKKSLVRIIEYHPEQQKYYAHRSFDNLKFSADESELEPYTEPDTSHEMPVCENQSDNTSQKEANMNSNRNLSQETANCDKQLDNILKDSFRNERRLNIAATITAGVMANPNIIKSRNDLKAISDEWLASRTLELVDALIAECEEGLRKIKSNNL